MGDMLPRETIVYRGSNNETRSRKPSFSTMLMGENHFLPRLLIFLAVVANLSQFWYSMTGRHFRYLVLLSRISFAFLSGFLN